MQGLRKQGVYDRASILGDLLRSLEVMMRDWDLDDTGPIGPDATFVADLGFSSMDLVMLVVDIQQRYDCFDLPFDALFAPDGQYVDDLSVGEMVAFLEEHLNR